MSELRRLIGQFFDGWSGTIRIQYTDEFAINIHEEVTCAPTTPPTGNRAQPVGYG